MGMKSGNCFSSFFSLALTFLLLRSRREHCPNEMLVCSFAVAVVRQEGIHPSQLTSAILVSVLLWYSAVRHFLARWLTLIPVPFAVPFFPLIHIFFVPSQSIRRYLSLQCLPLPRKGPTMFTVTLEIHFFSSSFPTIFR